VQERGGSSLNGLTLMSRLRAVEMRDLAEHRSMACTGRQDRRAIGPGSSTECKIPTIPSCKRSDTLFLRPIRSSKHQGPRFTVLTPARVHVVLAVGALVTV
jgi:hypothetical protein